MIISSLQEVKTFIQNNIELCRLHDYLQARNQDACVQEIVGQTGTGFSGRIGWYTIINSLYSSVSLVHQYMKNQNTNVNTLDNTFTFATWNIIDCFEFDDSNNRNINSPSLSTIIRRLRNSVSHGNFELDNSGGEVRTFEVVFRDSNSRRGAGDTDKNFEFKILAINLLNFLSQIERNFNRLYP